MTENLHIWNKFADIDPKFTKPITGKPYKGTSPNPQYVIRCLTEMFGPVGVGFGWKVLAEEFQPLGDDVLHWCRIEFWHTDRANTIEGYGQTKAAYFAGRGDGRYMLVDEDAPKKSLTDAIIKASSYVGIAANIFLGRWDDQKYVAEVAKEYRAAESAGQNTPADDKPKHDPAAIAKSLIDAIGKAATAAELEAGNAEGTKFAKAWQWLEDNKHTVQAAAIRKAFDERMARLDNADLGDDEIPF